MDGRWGTFHDDVLAPGSDIGEIVDVEIQRTRRCGVEIFVC